MSTDEALEFLLRHQPLTKEDEDQQPVLDKLKEVIEFFDDEAHNIRSRMDPSMAALVLPLLLCMNRPDGCGLFGAIEQMLEYCPSYVVVPALYKAFASENSGTRMHAINVSCLFNDGDRAFVGVYRTALSSSDFIERTAAADALSYVCEARDIEWIRELASQEPVPHIRQELDKMVAELEASIPPPGLPPA